ncbi:MAG TPA: TonB-dependent receptor [Bryobacteraceae bacterium]|nr:TonB-dependent receptor [Bryobacteraceae bacterium]
MDNLWRKLMVGGSTAAMIAAAPNIAFAQGGGDDIEQVVVSASRIAIAGYQAPTPVTVVGAAQLERDAFADIGDAVRAMPALGTGVAPDNGGNSGLASQGTAGLSELGLRQLGATRTLVLFDNQRVVSSDVQGNAVDTGTLPQAIISRVDVVTGGASAAWGSDAVAGVINFVINKNFTGVKFNQQFTQNNHSNHFQSKTDLTLGDDFMGGRLHLEASGSYLMSPDAIFTQTMDWYRLQTLFPQNPATASTTNACIASNPCYHTPGITGSATYAPGGLITSGPFKNTVFTGNNGTPATFNPGIIWNGNCYNCTYNKSSATADGLLGVPYHSFTFFGYGRYRLSDTLSASIQINVGTLGEHNINSDLQKVNTILSGNPYIPATIQAQMTAGGITSIPVGTNNLQGCDIDHPTVDGLEACQVADGENIVHRLTTRAVFTLDGALGEDWSWTAYFQTGQMREQQQDPGDAVNTRYANAVDAVVVTTANRGTSGLAIGQITCRSTLTNPTNGCQPLNIFGTAPVSAQTLAYVDPGRLDLSLEDTGHWINNQQVASASMQGTLPWELPAGKVAVAFGGEWHLQQERAIADAAGLGPIAGYNNGNYTQWAGGYSVVEGFGEVDFPILKDNFVQSLDGNMAGRVTNYSTSGTVETWKIGLTSQVNDDIRLRTTWSTDIRAPDLFELFTPASFAHNTGIDPKTNKSVSLYTGNAGNANLVPETATTVSGGLVLTPSFLPGFNASFDWYSIVIKGAIFTAGTTAVQAQCALGVQLFCTQLHFANGTAPDPLAPLSIPDYPNALVLVINAPLNAASESTSGLDFQANYSSDLWGGTMAYQLLGNYTDTYTRSALGITTEAAGSLSSSGNSAALTGNVKLKFTLSATYDQGPWSATVQGRIKGPAKLSTYWTNGIQIDNNDIPWVGYLDVRGSYKWNDHVQFYTAVNNITNSPPPLIPTAQGGIASTNTQIYDGQGRMYQMGVRVNY